MLLTTSLQLQECQAQRQALGKYGLEFSQRQGQEQLKRSAMSQ